MFGVLRLMHSAQWHDRAGLAVRGVAQVNIAGASDLVLRNVNTGAFQGLQYRQQSAHRIGEPGAVGLDWQLGGFAHYCKTRQLRKALG
jgi:hypothetical protein